VKRRYAAVLACALVAAAQAGELQPFVSGSLQQIVAARHSQPFILAFWSLDCSHCQDELALFGKLARQTRLPLVLVSTDSPAQAPQLRAALRRHGLQSMPAWVFADDNADRLRFEIDKHWYGELPRSYLYQADGRAEAVSGKLEPARLAAWLRQVRQP